MSQTSAKVIPMLRACDRCGEFTALRDLQPLDDDGGQWCIDCHAERAQREYDREPEINPDR